MNPQCWQRPGRHPYPNPDLNPGSLLFTVIDALAEVCALWTQSRLTIIFHFTWSHYKVIYVILLVNYLMICFLPYCPTDLWCIVDWTGLSVAFWSLVKYFRIVYSGGTWLWDDLTLNSAGCSILQCGTSLWNDMTLNSLGGSTLWLGTPQWEKAWLLS